MEVGAAVLLNFSPLGGAYCGTVLARYPFDATALENEQQALEAEIAALKAALPPPPPPMAVAVGAPVEHNWNNGNIWYDSYTVTAIHSPTEADGGTGMPTYDLVYSDGSTVLGAHPWTIRINATTYLMREPPPRPPALVRAEDRLALLPHLLVSAEPSYDVAVTHRCVFRLVYWWLDSDQSSPSLTAIVCILTAWYHAEACNSKRLAPACPAKSSPCFSSRWRRTSSCRGGWWPPQRPMTSCK